MCRRVISFIFGTIWVKNNLSLPHFSKKNRDDKKILKKWIFDVFLCFLMFFRCFLFCWQWISRNCINAYFLCKFDDNRIKIDNLTHKNLLIFIEQKIFEKSFFAIENFKSGKLWIFLHFEKHQKMRNWIF